MTRNEKIKLLKKELREMGSSPVGLSDNEIVQRLVQLRKEQELFTNFAFKDGKLIWLDDAKLEEVGLVGTKKNGM